MSTVCDHFFFVIKALTAPLPQKDRALRNANIPQYVQKEIQAHFKSKKCILSKRATIHPQRVLSRSRHPWWNDGAASAAAL